MHGNEQHRHPPSPPSLWQEEERGCFVRRLQPEREAALNWAIDVAALLQRYLRVVREVSGEARRRKPRRESADGAVTLEDANGEEEDAAEDEAMLLSTDFVEGESRSGPNVIAGMIVVSSPHAHLPPAAAAAGLHSK